MTALSIDLVLGVAGAIVVLSTVAATWRFCPRDVGLLVGTLLLLAGGTASLWVPLAQIPGLVLDGVSLPRLPLSGLFLLIGLAVVPARDCNASRVAALTTLVLSDLALTMVEPSLASGVLWALSCGATLAVLPAGPARRLAFPYLTLALAAGLGGLVLGGQGGLLLLVVAVAIRLGLFPFQTWVVTGMELTTPALLVTATAPMTAIALVARTPLTEDAVAAPYLVPLFTVGALLTGALSIIQERLTRAVGFLTISISGVVLVGVLDADEIGHLGGLIMWGITGLSLLGLGLVTAALQSRLGVVSIRELAGLGARVPTFGALFLLFGLAAVGAPGTADFASEDLVLHGSLAHHPAQLLLFVSTISVQGYAVLHVAFRAFFGPHTDLPVRDALPRERLALVGLALLLVVAGLAPQLMIMEWSGPAAEEVASVHPLHP